MTARTHDLAAFTTLGIIVFSYPLPHITLATGLVAVVANLVGGIAPDIDQPTAPLWRNLPVGKYVGKTFDKLLGGHRFISHSIIGLVLFGSGWYYLLHILKPSFPALDMDIIWWAFIIGFISHLVMDTFTHEGVPWLLPIPVKLGFPPFKALRITTDGLIEKFAVFPGLFLLNGYMYYLHYGTILELFHTYLK